MPETHRAENLPRHEAGRGHRASWHLVEGRHRRQDHRPGLSRKHHVAELRQAHRRRAGRRRLRRAFSMTSAARSTRLRDRPWATPARSSSSTDDHHGVASWLPLATLAPDLVAVSVQGCDGRRRRGSGEIVDQLVDGGLPPSSSRSSRRRNPRRTA